MKSGRAFWGAFLAAVGCLLLLDRFAALPAGWEGLWRLWPLVFVAWGAGLLLGRGSPRWIAALIAGLILGITLVALVVTYWAPEELDWDREPVVRDIRVPWDSTIERASLSLEGGAGKFMVSGISADLLDAEYRTNLGEYRLTQDTLEGEVNLRLSMADGRSRWRLGGIRNRVDLRLHPDPAWNLEADVGAAGVDFDLEDLDVRRLELNTGAASVRLRLGGRADSAEVRITAGASSIRISVPDTVGCEVDVEAPLSRKDFAGFEKLNSGLYRTEGFGGASHLVRIRINAGVSTLTIERE
jgi:hypothetical protein